MRPVAESMCAGAVFEQCEKRIRNFIDATSSCAAAGRSNAETVRVLCDGRNVMNLHNWARNSRNAGGARGLSQ